MNRHPVTAGEATGRLVSSSIRGALSFRVECSCGWSSEDVPASIGAGVAWQSFEFHRDEETPRPAPAGCTIRADRSIDVHEIAHRAGLDADRRAR